MPDDISDEDTASPDVEAINERTRLLTSSVDSSKGIATGLLCKKSSCASINASTSRGASYDDIDTLDNAGGTSTMTCRRNSGGESTTETNLLVSCPVCQGQGNISQDHKSHLTSIMERRSRATSFYFWTFGCIGAGLLFATITTFLLLPRAVTVSSAKRELTHTNLSYAHDGKGRVTGMLIYFDELYTVRNDNYYHVQLTNLTLSMWRPSERRAEQGNNAPVFPQLAYAKSVLVPARANWTIVVKVRYAAYAANDESVEACMRETARTPWLFAEVHTELSFAYGLMFHSTIRRDVRQMQHFNCSVLMSKAA